MTVWNTHGLGDATSVASGITAQAVAAGGKFAASSIATALGLPIPVVGLAVAALTFAIPMIFNAFRGCGETCTEATHIADQAEQALQMNLNAYLSGPRTVSSQLVALDTFDKVWGIVSGPQGCGNPALQQAGQRCVSERARGGHVPGVSRPGSWFEWYRDPIAQDPNVVPDPVLTVDEFGNQIQAATGISPRLIGAGLLATAALVMD
jgi:hypothetical protein